MKRLTRWVPSVLAGAVAALAAGCSVLPETQPDRTRYYVLTSPAAPAGAEAATVAGAEQPLRVLVRPVVVPEFLRSRIVPVRIGANELRFIDEARWAEPLEAALTRVIADRLAQSAGVRVYERRGEAHDFEVAVRVAHCEGVTPAGVVRLAAHVEIYSADVDQRLVGMEDFAAEIPGWDGKDYGALARKVSEAANSLGGRIGELLINKKK